MKYKVLPIKLNLSSKLLIILIGALFFGNFLPVKLQSALYAISLNLKGLLLFILPIIIFSCIFSCLLTFRGGKALGFMLILFAFVCLSNCISTFLAYGIGALELVHIETAFHGVSTNQELLPLWNFDFPTWLPNEYALYLGFLAGAIFSFFPAEWAYRFSQQARRTVTVLLEAGFIPLLPLFALGFILKMQHDGILLQIVESYLPLMLIIIAIYICYLAFLFAIAAHFKFKLWLDYLKNILPIALMGFSTMSSLATMPVTIKAAEKNTGNIDLARAIIPATVNNHLIGLGISIPLMALAILLNFGHSFPSFTLFCQFALDFVLAQFAMAAVPGGGILVILPILETHFKFTGEMSALITALYILFDPAITITNVLGNSALVIIVSKFFKRFHTKI